MGAYDMQGVYFLVNNSMKNFLKYIACPTAYTLESRGWQNLKWHSQEDRNPGF